MLLLLLFLMVVVLLLFPLLLLEKMMGSNNPFYQSPDEYPPGGTRVRVPAGFPVGDEPFDFSPMLELELPVPFCIADPPFCVSDVYPVPVTGLPSGFMPERVDVVVSGPLLSIILPIVVVLLLVKLELLLESVASPNNALPSCD